MPNMIKSYFKQAKLILILAKNDLHSRYLDSVLGVFWAFIQPIATLCVLWFVFQVGFKSQPVENVPFIVWLAAGMVPWFMFSDIVLNGSTSVVNSAYLVKKVVFPVSYLPLVSWMSALAIGLVFNLFLLILLFIYNIEPSIYWLQIPYLFICIAVIALAITHFTSTMVVFFKDMAHLVNIIIQLILADPCFWSKDMIPDKYSWFIDYNPVAYIIDGYRMAILSDGYIVSDLKGTLYFWTLSIIMMYLGKRFFNSLKEHFADVL